MLFHGLVVVLVDAVALLLLAAVLPGFRVDGIFAAISTGALLGLINAFVWPVLSRFTLRITVLTLGLFGLMVNALILAAAILAMPWLQMDGLTEALIITFSLAVLTSLVSSLLAIDEDSTWYLNIVQRQIRVRGRRIESGAPGIVFLEIDGLAHDVLRRALANGSAPTMAQLVRDGDFTLDQWETDWSSQTGACQAGILHGNNHDMPAFRWWEKDRDRPIVTNHPRDAAEIERRQSNGAGLLADDGASRANILSGDAPHSLLTMSTVLERRKGIGKDYAAYFARPYAVIKTASFAVIEVFRERAAAIRQERQDVRPRIKRNWSYAVMRAWATVVQLDLQVAAVVGDMLAGRPAVYTTFLAYDEVAHHSGIERVDSLQALEKVDRQIRRIMSIADLAPRPYRFVILSDHGQSQGITFLDRYDQSLEALVSELCRGAEVADVSGGEDDARAYISASFTESSTDSAAAARLERATRSGEPGGHISETDVSSHQTDSDGKELPELSVMASGCLGLISFPRESGRLTIERIHELYPDLIPGLVQHPGIGFLLVRSGRDGPLAIGASGTHFLGRDRVDGEDPLLPFGPNAARHVLRTDSFPHCPDLILNSTYWEDLDEVAAFEELVGSHGGLGGSQSYPFVLHPVDMEWPEEPVIGAESVYEVFKDWQVALSESFSIQSSGDLKPVDSPGDSTRTSVSGE
ncbi:MAG: phage holin family protein [Solirubrobacterales bacterium]